MLIVMEVEHLLQVKRVLETMNYIYTGFGSKPTVIPKVPTQVSNVNDNDTSPLIHVSDANGEVVTPIPSSDANVNGNGDSDDTSTADTGLDDMNLLVQGQNETQQDSVSSRRCLVIIMVVVAILLSFAFIIFIGYNVFLWTLELKSQEYNYNTTTGDTGRSVSFTLLHQLNSTISSVTVSLINPVSNLIADIYLSSIKPPEYIENLSTIIPILQGKSRFNYNFNGGDEPIYLTAGSLLIYNVSVKQDIINATCPARLYLFKNFTNYHNFRKPPSTNPKINYAAISPCLQPSNDIWNITINDSSTYYVGIDIDTGTSVTSNVMVNRVNYNTSGLQRSTQLTSSNPTDTITTCENGNRFLCTRNNDQYLIVSINDYSIINFQLKTSQVYGAEKKAFFSMIFVMTLPILILVIIIVILYCKKCRTRTR